MHHLFSDLLLIHRRGGLASVLFFILALVPRNDSNSQARCRPEQTAPAEEGHTEVK